MVNGRPVSAVSGKRILQLLAAIVAIPCAVWGVLWAYTSIEAWLRWSPPPHTDTDSTPTLANALAQKRHGLVTLAANVPPPDGAPRLGPGDEFFRQMNGGIAGDPGALGKGDGEVIHGMASRFVRKADVLAKRLTDVVESDPTWNIFVGHVGPVWYERIEWCLRLRYDAGQENAFAYSLWQLSHEAFGDALGIPNVARDQPVTDSNGTKYIDPRPWQGLLLPISTVWRGDGTYSEYARHRSWQIEPDSTVCAAARAATR